MVKIYVKNADGQKVYVEVTDEQAKEYRDECRREWRNIELIKSSKEKRKEKQDENEKD